MSDTKQDATVDGGRRGFLKFAAAAPVAAAAAGAATTEAEASVTPGTTRLADTEHTRAYYASARF
jgi:hypothetical protein